jgi:uncharacterized protein (TIGR04222 family)
MAAGARPLSWETDAGPLDLYDLALLRGGEPLAVRVAAVRLHEVGALRVSGQRLGADGPVPRDAHPVEHAVYDTVASAPAKPAHISTLIRDAARSPGLAAPRRRLAELGLLVYGARGPDKLLRTAAVWVVIAVVTVLEAADALFDLLSWWQAALIAVPGLLLFVRLASIRVLRTRKGRAVLAQASKAPASPSGVAPPLVEAAGEGQGDVRPPARRGEREVRLALEGWSTLSTDRALLGEELYTALRGY